MNNISHDCAPPKTDEGGGGFSLYDVNWQTRATLGSHLPTTFYPSLYSSIREIHVQESEKYIWLNLRNTVSIILIKGPWLSVIEYAITPALLLKKKSDQHGQIWASTFLQPYWEYFWNWPANFHIWYFSGNFLFSGKIWSLGQWKKFPIFGKIHICRKISDFQEI